MKELVRRIRFLFEALIAGDQPWGFIRLVFTVLVLMMGLILFFIFFPPVIDALVQIVDAILTFLKNIFHFQPATPPTYPQPPKGHVYPPPPSTIVHYLLDLIATLWYYRRYFIALFAAFIIAFLVGGWYVQDIYELSSYLKGLHYVINSVFGLLNYPSVEISDGKMQVRPDEVNTIKEIGGPGFVIIRPGNLVLFERLHSPAAVHSAGKHFISRFETIKDVVPLEEQDGISPESIVSTKDGIEVKVRDVRFRYRLYPGRRYGGLVSRTWEEPYPYSPQAVKNYVYNRSIDENGNANNWFFSVKSVVDGAISEYISHHTIDELTAPGKTNSDPRGKIKETLFSARSSNRLRDVGAELLWCDIGHFEIIDKRVSSQRLETWQMKWMGKAELTRAEGEARRLAYQERGRAEGQAELLQSIARSLEELGLDREKAPARLRSIVLMRTAQILEAMTARYHLPEGGSDQKKPNTGQSGSSKLTG